MLTPQVTAASLASSSDLLSVGRFGVGYDSVDVDACTEHDVLATVTAGAVDRPVAEATIGWMIALTHHPTAEEVANLSWRTIFEERRNWWVTHEVAKGIHARIAFEGDIFEMEDQRNWTDASFKTYIESNAPQICVILDLPTRRSSSHRIPSILPRDLKVRHRAEMPNALTIRTVFQVIPGRVPFGIGYPFDQVSNQRVAEPVARALPVTGDGAQRIVDDDPGLQPDSHHGVFTKPLVRDIAIDQFIFGEAISGDRSAR